MQIDLLKQRLGDKDEIINVKLDQIKDIKFIITTNKDTIDSHTYLQSELKTQLDQQKNFYEEMIKTFKAASEREMKDFSIKNSELTHKAHKQNK